MPSNRRRGRRALRTGLALAAALFAAALTQPAAAQGDTLTVATDGDDAAPGTVAAPLRTIQRAVDLSRPGTVIQIRGGTYAPETNIRIQKDGTASQPITMRAYDGERVVIDGENMPNTPAPVGESYPRIERGAIHVAGDWWRFEGLEIVNGPYGIFAIESSHNVYRDLATHDNYETGLHLVLDSDDNRIVNLDSYRNRDPRKNGESADGLAIKQGSGTGNVVVGARLWDNADDGFDSWDFLDPIRVEDSAAWGNGFDRWGFPDWEGDGNGFKLGRGDADHVVTGSIAFDNAVGGFIDNGNTASIRLENNTAWSNGGRGFVFDRSTSTLHRNLALSNGAGVDLGSSGGAGNSWDIKSDWSDADLESTDASVLTGPRGADGTIRSTDFLRPRGYPNLGADFSGGGEVHGRYEAERPPALCDGVVEANHAGYSGSGFCNSRNAAGAWASFTVEASSAGEADIAIRFANGAPAGRPAVLSVNGAEAATVSFPATGAWSTWETRTYTVSLQAGPNTIRFVAAGADGLPNLDYLEMD